MKTNKFTPGLILCLILAAFWLAFSLRPKPPIQQTLTEVVKNSTPIVEALTAAPKAQAAAIVGKNIHVPVLMYHHVGELVDAAAYDLTVSAADFESQVQYFKNLGYETVNVKQIYEAIEHGGALPKKPIVFTFDDGYKDVFVNAVPILQKYGYTGSFAIATELLERPTYASFNDVIAANKAGMEILSHTENHLDLSNPIYSADDLHREIYDSKKILEQKLGVQVDFFVYPYGKSSAQAITMLKDAGYKMAFTTAYGQDVTEANLFTEPRVRVHGGPEGMNKLKKIIWK